jgi:hypothetical protein
MESTSTSSSLEKKLHKCEHNNIVIIIASKPYFRWTKISPSPATFFRQCGKGCHILYVKINAEQKVRMTKNSPMRADREIGESFLLAKVYGTLKTLAWGPWRFCQPLY